MAEKDREIKIVCKKHRIYEKQIKIAETNAPKEEIRHDQEEWSRREHFQVWLFK